MSREKDALKFNTPMIDDGHGLHGRDVMTDHQHGLHGHDTDDGQKLHGRNFMTDVSASII